MSEPTHPTQPVPPGGWNAPAPAASDGWPSPAYGPSPAHGTSPAYGTPSAYGEHPSDGRWQPATPTAAPPAPPRRSGAGRLFVITVLLAVGTVLGALAPITVWSRTTLLGADRFTATLAPLASDPGVQRLVINTVDTRITSSLGAAGSVAAGAVNTIVTRVVTGPEFPGLWRAVCRAAHPGVVTILTGRSVAGSTVSTSNNQLVLDVGPVIAYVKQQLAGLGLPVSGLPTTGAPVPVADVPGLSTLQPLVRLVDTTAYWLAVLAVLAFALAVAVARGRLRVLAVTGVLVALAMLADLLVVSAAKAVYVHQTSGIIDEPTARQAYDTIVHGLRTDLLIILITAVVVTAAAVVTEQLLHRRASAPAAIR